MIFTPFDYMFQACKKCKRTMAWWDSNITISDFSEPCRHEMVMHYIEEV